MTATASPPGSSPTPADSPLVVRKADRSEAGAAAAALAAAFFDDPVFRWIYAEESRMASGQLFFDEVLDALAPHDDTWTTGPEVLGAAQWVPYGREVMPAARNEAFGARMFALPGADPERITSLVSLLDEHHPHEPHEYLWFLGVVPGAQGRGIGGQLMGPVLQRADEAGHPAYLEASSARSKVLYERHGFTARDPIRAGDGPLLWPMWRDPQG